MEAHTEIPSLDQCWTPATDGHLYVAGEAKAENTTALKHWARELAEDSWEVWGLGDQTELAELSAAGGGVFGSGEVRQFEVKMREICEQMDRRYAHLENRKNVELSPVAIVVDDLDRVLNRAANDPELQGPVEGIRFSLAACQRIGRTVGVHVLKTVHSGPELGADEMAMGKLVHVTLARIFHRVPDERSGLGTIPFT
ncbi:hypothetical protein ACIPVK_03965 [Paeniglutamicibacter sp. MACA_103]|uniref:hypothetical protein n=1 Tax=Paeniglutamicibacter sp. MACA_103 TaxID=3377337 RepID=UPI0038945FCD